eukprot:4052690-Amphidinium_carterae.1
MGGTVDFVAFTTLAAGQSVSSAKPNPLPARPEGSRLQDRPEAKVVAKVVAKVDLGKTHLRRRLGPAGPRPEQVLTSQLNQATDAP